MAETSLYDEHVSQGAKVVDFHGWALPLHYGSQIEEHLSVRNDAGMFDVSHMTVVDVLGAGGRQFLLHLLSNNVDELTTGQALYSCMLNQHGCIMDDLIVYYRSSDNYRLVLNAATRDKDLNWLRSQAKGFSVGLQERPDLGILAIQGPNAVDKAMACFNAAKMDAISTLREFEGVDVLDWFIARTGYTGEEGLEVILPNEQMPELWQALLKQGVKPCGLGARDSLRLEAGMMLYGQDMDETTTPYESGLAWTVKLTPADRDFIGRGGLNAQKQRGIERKMVGLVLEDKGVLRPGLRVFSEGVQDGIITSGGYSPTLEKSIAFARVPVEMSASAFVEIRSKTLPVTLTKPRFVRRGKVII